MLASEHAFITGEKLSLFLQSMPVSWYFSAYDFLSIQSGILFNLVRHTLSDRCHIDWKKGKNVTQKVVKKKQKKKG